MSTQQHLSVEVSWDEILRLDDRQLRRTLADRYQAAARAERVERAVPLRLPREMVRRWNVEVARLEDAAAAVYEELAAGYPQRARAEFAKKAKPPNQRPGPRVAPLDAWKDLVTHGETPVRALERLGTNRLALERAAYRHGRQDVLQLLGIQIQQETSEEVTAA